MLGNYYLATVVVVLLSGCASSRSQLEFKKENLLEQGYSHNYVDGYADGCQTGRRSVGDKKSNYIKDQQRFAKDEDYQEGWQHGHTFCQEHMRDMILNNKGSYDSSSAIERDKQRMWDELKK